MTNKKLVKTIAATFTAIVTFVGAGLGINELNNEKKATAKAKKACEDVQKKKELPINIYVVGGVLAGILVLFLVIKILRKTSKTPTRTRSRKIKVSLMLTFLLTLLNKISYYEVHIKYAM